MIFKKLSRRIFSLALVLATAFTLCACDEIGTRDLNAVSVKEPTAYPVTVDGKSFDSAPTIVSLSPLLTSIIADVGGNDLILASCGGYRAEGALAQRQPAFLSSAYEVDEIIGFAPELVVTITPLAELDVRRLSDSGIDYFAFTSPSTLAEYLDLCAKLSIIVNGSIDAQGVTDDALASVFEQLKSAQSNGFDYTFAVIQSADCYVMTGDRLISDLLSVYGSNCASDGSKYEFALADLVEIQPDYIIFTGDIQLEVDENGEISTNISEENLEIISSLDAYQASRRTFVDAISAKFMSINDIAYFLSDMTSFLKASELPVDVTTDGEIPTEDE